MATCFSTNNENLKLQSSNILTCRSYLTWRYIAVIIVGMLSVRAAYDWLQDYRSYYMKVIMVMIVLLKIIAWSRQSKLNIYFSEKNKLLADFVATTKISTLTYRPWIMTLVPPAQFICYLVWEQFMQKFFPPKFKRETFLLPDGGTMGIDWNTDLPFSDEEDKPILLLIPGLSGANSELYLTTMMHAASKDFNVGCILLRGAAGLPITSARFSNLLSADDAKEAIDFVNNKYVMKVGGGKKRRLYVYGCSMGANILGLYLIQQGEKALVDGAIMYGTPWETLKNKEYFYGNWGGIFSYPIGVTLSNFWKDQFKQMKRFIDKKEVERIEYLLDEDAKSLLPVDSTHAFARILGRDTLDSYIADAAIGGNIENIKVPTFALSSMDDALCDPRCIPFEAASKDGSHVMICTTQAGNHVCHFTGSNSDFAPEQWFPYPFMMFLDFLENHANNNGT